MTRTDVGVVVLDEAGGVGVGVAQLVHEVKAPDTIPRQCGRLAQGGPDDTCDAVVVKQM